MLSRFTFSPFVSTFNGVQDCLYYSKTTNDGESYYVTNRIKNNDHRLRQTENMVSSLREQVVCLTVIAGAEALGDVETAVEEQFGDHVEIHLFENQYSPGWYWLTIHDRRAT